MSALRGMGLRDRFEGTDSVTGGTGYCGALLVSSMRCVCNGVGVLSSENFMSPFTVSQTHGIVARASSVVRRSSEGFGWCSLFASLQTESSFQGEFGAVSDPLLVFHLDGPVNLRTLEESNAATRVMTAGSHCLWPGRAPVRLALEGRINTLHLYIRRALIDDVAREMGFAVSGVDLTQCMGARDELLERLALEVRDVLTVSSYPPRYGERLAGAIAARVVVAHFSSKRASYAQPGLDRQARRWNGLREYMEARLDQTLSVDHLAGVAGMCRTDFGRWFRATTGLSVHQYLLRERVARASRLLRESDRPIKRIALECGFAHQEHLTRVFGRLTGVSPAVFRRRGPIGRDRFRQNK